MKTRCYISCPMFGHLSKDHSDSYTKRTCMPKYLDLFDVRTTSWAQGYYSSRLIDFNVSSLTFFITRPTIGHLARGFTKRLPKSNLLVCKYKIWHSHRSIRLYSIRKNLALQKFWATWRPFSTIDGRQPYLFERYSLYFFSFFWI